MKPEKNSSIRRSCPIRGRVLALGLAWGAIAVARAQTAEALLPPAAAPAPAAEEKAPAKSSAGASAPASVEFKPSRFAGELVEAYTLARAAAFAMAGRTTDPFGLLQDPSVKPPPNRTPQGSVIRREALPPVALQEIIKLIRVTTIMPAERKFLVGTRVFRESDEFPINFQGRLMRMKVVQVSSSKIVFRNLDNGETATLSTGMLPPGMVPGKEAIQPAGLVSPADDLPLDLGSQNTNFLNE
jgi:hypothetical protein